MKSVEELQYRVNELTEALPDPGKLWSLAAWLDQKYPYDTEPEIQRELRQWARRIYDIDPERYRKSPVYDIEE